MLALIAAGAIGNLYDRLNFGYVRDFLRLNVTASWASWGGEEGHIWPYVFNIADVWLTVGVIGLAILWLMGAPLCGSDCKTDGKKKSPGAATPSSAPSTKAS